MCPASNRADIIDQILNITALHCPGGHSEIFDQGVFGWSDELET